MQGDLDEGQSSYIYSNQPHEISSGRQNIGNSLNLESGASKPIEQSSVIDGLGLDAIGISSASISPENDDDINSYLRPNINQPSIDANSNFQSGIFPQIHSNNAIGSLLSSINQPQINSGHSTGAGDQSNFQQSGDSSLATSSDLLSNTGQRIIGRNHFGLNSNYFGIHPNSQQSVALGLENSAALSQLNSGQQNIDAYDFGVGSNPAQQHIQLSSYGINSHDNNGHFKFSGPKFGAYPGSTHRNRGIFSGFRNWVNGGRQSNNNFGLGINSNSGQQSGGNFGLGLQNSGNFIPEDNSNMRYAGHNRILRGNGIFGLGVNAKARKQLGGYFGNKINSNTGLQGGGLLGGGNLGGGGISPQAGFQHSNSLGYGTNSHAGQQGSSNSGIAFNSNKEQNRDSGVLGIHSDTDLQKSGHFGLGILGLDVNSNVRKQSSFGIGTNLHSGHRNSDNLYSNPGQDNSGGIGLSIQRSGDVAAGGGVKAGQLRAGQFDMGSNPNDKGQTGPVGGVNGASLGAGANTNSQASRGGMFGGLFSVGLGSNLGFAKSDSGGAGLGLGINLNAETKFGRLRKSLNSYLNNVQSGGIQGILSGNASPQSQQVGTYADDSLTQKRGSANQQNGIIQNVYGHPNSNVQSGLRQAGYTQSNTQSDFDQQSDSSNEPNQFSSGKNINEQSNLNQIGQDSNNQGGGIIQTDQSSNDVQNGYSQSGHGNYYNSQESELENSK